MTTARYIEKWAAAGVISPEQSAALTALVRKERFSVFLELNALLYLGVLSFAAGLGWTVREHFASFGDLAILGALGAIVAATFYYCFTRAAPYSTRQVESPTFAFDYVLYLGCLAFAIGIGYVEYRFQLLRENWDAYLLASSVVFFLLAYRFDNRFVLSLALSTLAGWFGIRLAAWHALADSIRGLAIVYGVLVAGLGLWTHRQRIKAHFLEAYLHVAANAVLLALTSGATDSHAGWLWLVGLLAVAAASVVLGIRFKRFAFVVYGVLYAYVGVSKPVVDALDGGTAILSYFIVSGIAVVAGLVVTARRVGREA